VPLLSYRIPIEEIIAYANRLLRVYEGLDMPVSGCRMRVTITILQLETGDVIAVSAPLSHCLPLYPLV
jgi:hypothetical protein